MSITAWDRTVAVPAETDRTRELIVLGGEHALPAVLELVRSTILQPEVDGTWQSGVVQPKAQVQFHHEQF